MSTSKPENGTAAKTRRRFLKGAVIGTAGATAAVAMPNVSRAQTVTLKMQSSWGATSPFQDMAKQYIQRVESMAGGRLKVDLLPSGAVVKAFQVQDACQRRCASTPLIQSPHIGIRQGQSGVVVRYRSGVWGQCVADRLHGFNYGERQRTVYGSWSQRNPAIQCRGVFLHADADATPWLVHGATSPAPSSARRA